MDTTHSRVDSPAPLSRPGAIFDPFLGFIPNSAAHFLGDAKPIPMSLVDRVQALVAGVDFGDLNAPLLPDGDD